MHGCGLFAVRRESWLGFNNKFTFFGGQQGYIHKKYQNDGRKVLCLSKLIWVHKFKRVEQKTPYYHNNQTRFVNYVIGWMQVGLDMDLLFNYWKSKVRPAIFDKYYGLWQENKKKVAASLQTDTTTL